MAGLDAKIEISKELRPCIITLENFSSRDNSGKIKRKQIKALFHCWVEVELPYYEKEFISGYIREEFKGFLRKIVGIIEDENGNVHEVESWQVKFVDNKIHDYAFPEK